MDVYLSERIWSFINFNTEQLWKDMLDDFARALNFSSFRWNRQSIQIIPLIWNLEQTWKTWKFLSTIDFCLKTNQTNTNKTNNSRSFFPSMKWAMNWNRNFPLHFNSPGVNHTVCWLPFIFNDVLMFLLFLMLVSTKFNNRHIFLWVTMETCSAKFPSRNTF